MPADSPFILPSKKIEILDSLRAFAALSVCLFHFVCTTTGYIETAWILNTFEAGRYGVQLFFVISGFVIPWSMHLGGYQLKDFFTFFLKRLSRLEPPYIFSLALAVAILYLRQKNMGEAVHIDAKQVGLHFAYLVPFFKDYDWLNPVYWTLAVEFQYYLFVALLFIPLVRSGFWQRCCAYVLIVALSFIPGIGFLFYWLPFFLLGILLFLFKAGFAGNKEYYIATALVLALCLVKYPLAAVGYAIIPLAFVLYRPGLKIAGLHVLGKFSYSIYLIHALIGASLINVLSHRFNSPFEKLLVIIFGMFATIVCAYGTYLLVEKPSKKLSASFRY